MRATLRKAINILKKGAERFGMLELGPGKELPKREVKPSERGAMLEYPGKKQETSAQERKRMGTPRTSIGTTSTGKKIWIDSHKEKGLTPDEHDDHWGHHADMSQMHRNLVESYNNELDSSLHTTHPHWHHQAWADYHRNVAAYHERAQEAAHSDGGEHKILATYTAQGYKKAAEEIMAHIKNNRAHNAPNVFPKPRVDEKYGPWPGISNKKGLNHL